MGIPGDLRDPDERQSRRATLIQLLGVTGNDADDAAPGTRARGRATSRSLPRCSGTLAPTVLRVAAVAGDATLYDQYVAQVHKLAAQPEEYYRFFNALPWFRDPALIKRTLAFAISPVVRTQDTGTLIANAIARPWSQDSAWEFTKAQWPSLVQKLGTFQGIPDDHLVAGIDVLDREGSRRAAVLREESCAGRRADAAAGDRTHRGLRGPRQAAIGADGRLAADRAVITTHRGTEAPKNLSLRTSCLRASVCPTQLR